MPQSSTLRNQVQLITYVDRFGGGGFEALAELLDGPLADVFGGVHVLPFFYPIDGADAGFDPIDHRRIDDRVGTWEGLKELGRDRDVAADLIVNHISAASPQFQDFVARGQASESAGLFLLPENVFPEGVEEADLRRIYRPRPHTPFIEFTFDDGRKRMLWTTFSADQIDIDVGSREGRAYLSSILEKFARHGVDLVRLDAVGYAVKTRGTSCFMTPETFDFIEDLTREVHGLGMEVLVEVHSHFSSQIEIAKRVDWVYDFALPPLILHALLGGTAAELKRWFEISPRNTITVLDTHDGIGVIDVGPSSPHDPESGLLDAASINSLVETIHEKSGGESKAATGAAADNLDLYQVNCTYFDALGRDETAYLLARLIQFFAPGIPQVYYVGLLAGTNDMDLFTRTRVGRDINRHFYCRDEIENALGERVVKRLLELIRFRNVHPAFSGSFELQECSETELHIRREKNEANAELRIDFERRTFALTSKIAGDTRVVRDFDQVRSLVRG